METGTQGTHSIHQAGLCTACVRSMCNRPPFCVTPQAKDDPLLKIQKAHSSVVAGLGQRQHLVKVTRPREQARQACKSAAAESGAADALGV